MKIKSELKETELTVYLEGELNSATAPELDKFISESLNGIETLIFDFAKLDYLSSAGLRILLVSQKAMDKQGKLIVRHVNEQIMDIFTMTGFINVLTIEN